MFNPNLPHFTNTLTYYYHHDPDMMSKIARIVATQRNSGIQYIQDMGITDPDVRRRIAIVADVFR